MKVSWEVKHSFCLQVSPHELHTTNCKGENIPLCMERSGNHQLNKMISLSIMNSRRAHYISSDVMQLEKKIAYDVFLTKMFNLNLCIGVYYTIPSTFH